MYAIARQLQEKAEPSTVRTVVLALYSPATLCSHGIGNSEGMESKKNIAADAAVWDEYQWELRHKLVYQEGSVERYFQYLDDTIDKTKVALMEMYQHYDPDLEAVDYRFKVIGCIDVLSGLQVYRFRSHSEPRERINTALPPRSPREGPWRLQSCSDASTARTIEGCLSSLEKLVMTAGLPDDVNWTICKAIWKKEVLVDHFRIVKRKRSPQP